MNEPVAEPELPIAEEFPLGDDIHLNAEEIADLDAVWAERQAKATAARIAGGNVSLESAEEKATRFARIEARRKATQPTGDSSS